MTYTYSLNLITRGSLEMIYFELFISFTSMLMLYLMGSKWKYAPLLGLFNQVLWYILLFQFKQYGLLIGVTGYTIIHIRNTIKWMRGC